MSRTYINSLKNFRSENQVVKFDLGEESLMSGGVSFSNVFSVVMSESDFIGMIDFLSEKGKELSTPSPDPSPLIQESDGDPNVDQLPSNSNKRIKIS